MASEFFDFAFAWGLCCRLRECAALWPFSCLHLTSIEQRELSFFLRLFDVFIEMSVQVQSRGRRLVHLKSCS